MPSTTTVATSMPIGLARRIRQLAADQRRPLSWVVSDLLELGIQAAESGTEPPPRQQE